MQIQNDQLIKDWEELRLKAYLPTPNDRWTIGWGHTHTTKKGMVITKAEAQELFEQDTAWVEKTLADLVKVKLNQNQYDALASLVFNIGRSKFSTSTLLRKLNAGDYEGAANEFPKWRKQKGKVLRGLVRRRAQEMEYFLSPVDNIAPVQTVEAPDVLKSLGKSKELIGGAGAILTGAGSLIGGLTPQVQFMLAVALIGFGAFFVWNRIQARKKGER